MTVNELISIKGHHASRGEPLKELWISEEMHRELLKETEPLVRHVFTDDKPRDTEIAGIKIKVYEHYHKGIYSYE